MFIMYIIKTFRVGHLFSIFFQNCSWFWQPEFSKVLIMIDFTTCCLCSVTTMCLYIYIFKFTSWYFCSSGLTPCWGEMMTCFWLLCMLNQINGRDCHFGCSCIMLPKLLGFPQNNEEEDLLLRSLPYIGLVFVSEWWKATGDTWRPRFT